MDTSNKIERIQNPRANANILEVLTFSWMFNLFKTGRKRDLGLNDLYEALNDHKATLLGNELERKWELELADAHKKNKNPSLLKVLLQLFGTKIMICGFLLFLSDIILKVFQTLMLGGLLTYFNPEMTNKTDLKHAYIYASGLLISMLVSMVLFHNTLTQMAHFGMKIRVACCSLIFRKALRLSQKVYSEITVGHIVNLLSNDVNRFDLASPFLHHLWIGPLHTIVATYFIWQEIGASSLLGVATLILFIPLQGWLGKKTSEYRHRIAINTDERVRLVKEIILGIQVIKFYTWEKPFAYLVQCARKKEINLIRGTSVIRAVLVSFIVFNTKIALFISILLYVILGNYITAQKVFIVTSYYNQLRITMSSFFPRGIGYTAEVMITIKRIQNFLIYEEKDDKIANISRVDKITTDNHNSNNKLTSICNDNIHLKNYRVIISDATAKWTNHQTDNSLANINLCIKPGQLVAIIGPVGAGKSSLIQAILRELPLTRGTISVNGTVSYASQEPWLFSGTIQQNILFGLPMNRKRYEKVLRVCALNGDIKQFPNFDETIVGERGLSLSGGQRARINLARAIYKKADIYILDDPLSAVDTRVGSHLFEKCIKDYLKYSTCILITHQTQYLTNVDQIVLMENANVLAQGTYEELQASNLDFTKLLQSLVVPHNGCNTINESEFNLEPKIIHEPQLSIQNIESPVDEFKTKHILTTSIHRTQNHSSGQNLYLTYLKAGGTLCKISFFIFICVFTQVLISAESIWITYWVNLEENEFCKVKDTCVSNKKTTNDDHSLKIFLWWSISRQTCIIVYTIIICIILLITAIRSATFVSVCMSVSMNLHNRLLNAIIRGTMFFFHTNSSGYILDRFSKDMGVVDEILPISLMDSIHYGLSLVGIIIVVGIVNIYLMIPIFFLAIIFYKITIFYLTTSRNIRRLEGITRSSIFAHMNAALQGLTTIRAFKAEQILYNEFDKYQDVHSSAWYIFISSSRAFGFWLDLVCLVYISIVTFSFIVFDNDTFGGNVGLAITQVYSMANMLQWGLRQIAELENNMISVERLVEFTNCPQEYHTESLPDKKPSSNWPMNGQITFKNFCLRYSSNAPYVIKNLNISVESMQKVGVVGRTGAGKSSLIGALFRLALNEGNIIIDGIEIHELGLHDLRSKLSIIPQEPVLFTGTMRSNLDPFGEYPDHVLWNALDDVELKDVVEELPDGLNSKMSEGGGNFSVGQRQLVCLARAIVRNNKILVLDEVTANVDPQTDALIQNTIRNKFRTCTVITIAHRLNTVMDSDKVLVMDAGAAVEFDHPYNLLQNKNGHLYKLVEQTGRANADLLHGVAEENYKSTKMSESSTYR